MKIFALDTSSQSASCAVWEDGCLLGEFFTNVHLTHSQTILPMAQDLLTQTRLTLGEMDLFAVTNGPGSFTGLRIGLAAVKGMAHALGKPCLPISTLEALAYNYQGTRCLVAPVLDARCAQVYTALFRWEGAVLTRLCEDAAIPLSELAQRLKNLEEPVFLVGDGAEMCYNKLGGQIGEPLLLSAPALRYTHAAAVACAAAQAAADQTTFLNPAELAPVYLRLPQAERELLAKKQRSGKT